jgi:hypothetical protein
MTRRRRPEKKKKKSGLIMGMRSGVQKVAGKVTGGDGEDATEAVARARWKVIASNVVTGLLVVAAGAMILRRCGVVHF